MGELVLIFCILGLAWQVVATFAGRESKLSLILLFLLQVPLYVKVDKTVPSHGFAVLILLAGYFLLVTGSGIGSQSGRRAASILMWAFISIWIWGRYVRPFLEAARLGCSLSFAKTELGRYGFVGISYIGFRFIQFIADRDEEDIQRSSVLDYLSWIVFVPTLLAGPIMRYQDWLAEKVKTGSILDHCLLGSQRIVEGLFLKVVLAESIRPASLASMTLEELSRAHWSQILAGAMFYTLYLYWDFSGYSSIAIGVGHFWGFTVPENFNHPFISRNLVEFWRRWHITLGDFLRDNIFYPISLRMKRSPGLRRHRRFSAFVPPFVTFLIAGIWHGLGAGYVIYGIMQGAGLGVLAVLAITNPKEKGWFRRWWDASFVCGLLAVAINFTYVSISMGFFALSNEGVSIVTWRLIGLGAAK